MARLTALPSLDIIHGFQGVLDFYLWKGLPCARKWPYTPPSHVTEGTIAARALFGAISQGYSLLGDGPLQAFQEDAADQTRTARDIYMTAVYGHLHERTEPEPPPPPEEEMYDAYVCLRDLKPSGTQGGTFNAGAWRDRSFTEKQADTEGICALNDITFILQPGSYRCAISCPAYRTSNHTARLLNLTAGATLLAGTAEAAHPSYYAATRSHIVGRFTIETAQTLKVQHRCLQSRANDGKGIPSGLQDEIYTVAEFWRELEAE